jgi:hypothetical protein
MVVTTTNYHKSYSSPFGRFWLKPPLGKPVVIFPSSLHGYAVEKEIKVAK